MKKQISAMLVAAIACSTMLMTSCKKPVTAFTADKTTAKVGEAVNFTNTSENASKVVWDFGDGTQSTSLLTSTSHVYAVKGSYVVSLRGQGNGATVDAAPLTITVVDPKTPVASFTASTSTPVAGQVVTFTSTSTDAEEFDWDFGDGSSTLANDPVETHVYATGGSYSVTLSVYAVNHTLVSTKSMTITVGGATGNHANQAMMVGTWKFTSKSVTDVRNGVAYTSVNSDYDTKATPTVAYTDSYEFTAEGSLIKTDKNGNYSSGGSYSLLDDTRMKTFALSGTTASYGVSAPMYPTYVITATTLTITYVSTSTLPTYYEYTGCCTVSSTHAAGENQVVTTTYTFTK